VLSSLAQAMMPLGLAVVGPIADAVGVRMVMLVAIVVQILLGVAAFGWRTLLALEDGEGAPQPAAETAPIREPEAA